MLSNPKKKISIRTRILVSILGLIGTIFLGIAITFNLIVDRYIAISSNEQLEKAKIAAKNTDNHKELIKPRIKGEAVEPNIFFDFMKVIEEKIRMAQMKSDAQAIVISEDYELLFPTRKENFFKNIDEYEAILKEFKNSNMDLNTSENIKIATYNSNYYISFVKISNLTNSLINNQTYYLVLIIDISSTLSLAQNLNMVLIVVMFIAGLLALFITIFLSSNIAKPIKQLCEFANRIGEGDFSKYDLDFRDKELDELSTIMNKSVEKLDKYDKEQKIFFQNASHELRTPLMSIKGYAEAIKYNVIDKYSASDVILEESDRLGDMVEELLYISKVDNITKDYELVECDLREILSNCTIKQKTRAIKNSIEFKYDFDDNPVLFICDEKSIYRAFLNIIENGLRYANSEIIIGCRELDDKICVYIEDDGDGIKASDLTYIFDRFYKGDKGRHGIGLSIVKSIIEKHNGRIYAENSELGTKFTILFDIRETNIK
ncbi:sensor histidine kinase [Romboutsia sp.]|uniref:sensor histidine kinase n=1 Tax=Romboutsia sp. TaxID=1965302 RepID=UPI003F2C6943